MVFLGDYPEALLRTKHKNLKQVLTEKSLWRNWKSNGQAFLLKYSINHNRLGYVLLAERNCFA